ncbi:hypothetical protein QYM36_011878 [Artemia franciscana]|uniref:MICOS complex subunit MIC19 n=1 Tax=Artemia franciscana TaxID=6661 RepID=A0AA88HJH6_ARTSF|nr:hypothetical protein QYM36_011878 [Artemia franciscana]
MGNSGSTKKVTVERDEQGVIKVTESVIRRLGGQDTVQTTKREAQPPIQPLPAAPAPQTPETTTIITPTEPKEVPLPSQSSPSTEVKNLQLGQFLEEARIAAARIKQEKEAEIRNVEDQWRIRLQEMSEAHKRNTRTAEVEFERAVHDVNELLNRQSAQPICENLKVSVQQCYADHSSQVLRCADLVRDFHSAVEAEQVVSFFSPFFSLLKPGISNQESLVFCAFWSETSIFC